jgi:transposase InsO family protein
MHGNSSSKEDPLRRCDAHPHRAVHNESFNGKLREVEILIERWRQEYNTIRPHSSLGYRPPAPETIRLKQAVGLT